MEKIGIVDEKQVEDGEKPEQDGEQKPIIGVVSEKHTAIDAIVNEKLKHVREKRIANAEKGEPVSVDHIAVGIRKGEADENAIVEDGGKPTSEVKLVKVDERVEPASGELAEQRIRVREGVGRRDNPTTTGVVVGNSYLVGDSEIITRGTHDNVVFCLINCQTS